MERIPFNAKFSDGVESVMPINGLNPIELRFNKNTREIFIICEESSKYTIEDLDGLSWQAVKKLVKENGGEWKGVKTGEEFLTSL